MKPFGANPGSHGDSSPTKVSTVDGGDRVFAHLSDLQTQALSGYNRSGNIHQLLQMAEVALKQSETMLDFRRPDLSYVEYLRASQIVVEEMPHHKSWADFHIDSHGGLQRYNVLLKKINGKSEQYAGIKEIIADNNVRSGVQPRIETAGAVGNQGTNVSPVANGGGVNGHEATDVHKTKPVPSPKPDKLHGRAISAALPASSGDALSERFARLRMQQPADTDRPGSRGSITSSVQSSPISMPNVSDFAKQPSLNRSSLDMQPRNQIQHRPQGPREMPNGANGPLLPGKLPLNTSVTPLMPKEPSPAYSPARNMQIAGNIPPPRHSARSLVSTSARRTPTMSPISTSQRAPFELTDSANHISSPISMDLAPTKPTSMGRRKSVNVPKETQLSAQRLYDYLVRYSVLLIDFRPREEFDQGHIYSRNIINIDPFTVAPGMSADELLERMILSPDMEQEMFINRDTYELVVYYDVKTNSDTYLTNPRDERELKLKCLHEALYDFNQDKPLQRPPILLIGGIEAWADLVGHQALITSNTAAQAKQDKGIRRRPLATPNGSSQLRVQRRRLRDYNPLDAEEEMAWRERARAESVALPPPPPQSSQNHIDSNAEVDEDGDSKTAIQEFLERFPEAGTLERQSFSAVSHSSRQAPQIPAKVPMYPPTPPPSQVPSAPTRPKPAAPRPSYTGVSERAGYQNAPIPRSGQLAPYIPPKYLATNLRLPKTGLQNFGQTCYLNATMQALSATTPLSIYFLDDKFESGVQKDNWKGTKGVMPKIYSTLIRNLWKGDVDYVRPTTLRNFCGRLKKEWSSNEQQDAKEFFDFIVDCLHEDLNSMWARTPLRALTQQEEIKRERMPKSVVAKLEWGRFTHREQSFLTELFGGQHLSRLKCGTCGWTSTTYEAFYSISVEIPTPRSPSQLPTLDDCFRSYCQEERLTGDDRFKCEGTCNAVRDGTKQIIITRVPQFLVVHFKRFSTNAYGRNASKIRTPVGFPLHNFDLEPYVLPYPSPAEEQQISQQYPDLPAEACMTPPYTYDAYAVVRHIGATLLSGHYTVAVKDRARSVWRYFNDERSEDFQPGAPQGPGRGPGELRNEQAYIVFYQRNATDAPAIAGGKF